MFATNAAPSENHGQNALLIPELYHRRGTGHDMRNNFAASNQVAGWQSSLPRPLQRVEYSNNREMAMLK